MTPVDEAREALDAVSPFPVAIPADRPYPLTITVADATGSAIGTVTCADARAYHDALLLLGSAVVPLAAIDATEVER